MVKCVASGGKFYQLPPDKENTGLVNVNKSPNYEVLAFVTVIKCIS